MQSGTTDTTLPVDLTDMLRQGKKRIVGHGSFGTVYHCSGTPRGEVAVKVITFLHRLDETERGEFVRKVKRELGIWRRLDHPNIVPFLGRVRGEDFGSDHTGMVLMWMPHGTLVEYLKHCGTTLSLLSRIQLIKGSSAGLEYLHSKQIVHGDLHPGNILIDGGHNARLADFGFAQTLIPLQDQLAYLWTDSIRPGAVMFAAPELQYPDLYPDLKIEATLNSDVYSLSSTILFTLSGKLPWKNSTVAEDTLKEFQNPPRPVWPTNIPNGLWNFIERCWSPHEPRNRPSAQEVMSFSRDNLEQLLQPNPASDINVVLFGAVGCGKSSIINLLAEEPIAPVSTNMEPCTRRSRCYRLSIDGRRFRLWDTMGFRLAHGGEVSPLTPYQQAHAVLRNLPDGVNLILLCASKDGISASLDSLYWLINDFFLGGRAPIAFVVTHLDTLDEQWWERNQESIAARTGIPVQSIPHACVTTVQAGRDHSRQVLKALFQTHAIPPISPCLDLSPRATTSLTTHCRLSLPEATALVEEFGKPPNVVFFGTAGAGKSSVINLITEHPVGNVTLDSSAHTINILMGQFVIWETPDFFNGLHNGQDVTKRAVMEVAQLIRDLSEKSGVDLLVFVKKHGKLTTSELYCYRLVEEFLCEGQVPVAVVVTHLEDQDRVEQWWERHSDDLLEELSGNVIGHACITSLATHDQEDSGFSKKVSESRLAVQTMLKDCVSSPNKQGISRQSSTYEVGQIDRVPAKMTVDNLVDRCGLTSELAVQVVKLCGIETTFVDSFSVDMHQQNPGKSSRVDSVAHNDDGGDLLEVEVPSSTAFQPNHDESAPKFSYDDDLLEAEVPTNWPAPRFDYDEVSDDESVSPASSVHSHEEEAPPPSTSNAVLLQSFDALPTASPAQLEETLNTAKPSQGISIRKRLLQTWIGKSDKDPALHESDRVPSKSSQTADQQPRSQSPVRAKDLYVGPSRMATTRPMRRMAAISYFRMPRRTSPTKLTESNKGPSRIGPGTAVPAEADPAHQVNIHLSFKLPAWVFCARSANEDGTHG